MKSAMKNKRQHLKEDEKDISRLIMDFSKMKKDNTPAGRIGHVQRITKNKKIFEARELLKDIILDQKEDIYVRKWAEHSIKDLNKMIKENQGIEQDNKGKKGRLRERCQLCR